MRGEAAPCPVYAPSVGKVVPDGGRVFLRRVDSGRTLSVAYGDSSPEGRALGKEDRFRPHPSTAGRSLPLSGKLYAPAKASPFRERWHGEAVTERVASGRTLSVACGDSSPERGSPWQRGQVSPSPINGRKKPAVKLQTFRPCQSLSLSGEVARRSRDGEGSLPFCRRKGFSCQISLENSSKKCAGVLY